MKSFSLWLGFAGMLCVLYATAYIAHLSSPLIGFLVGLGLALIYALIAAVHEIAGREGR